MRAWLVVCGFALAACPGKAAPPAPRPPAAAAPSVDRNPYKDVMPAKVKAEVEAIQKKEEDRDDAILEKAKQ